MTDASNDKSDDSNFSRPAIRETYREAPSFDEALRLIEEFDSALRTERDATIARLDAQITTIGELFEYVQRLKEEKSR